MDKFAIIEVGSTNTKGYICNGNDISELPFITIQFKNNYKQNGTISTEDKNKLYEYINNIKKNECDNVHVYGTSIFRDINETERSKFISEFYNNINAKFNIVSSDEENEYTVHGVIDNIDYTGKLAVMIGGGGSTELSIIENNKIIEKKNYKFGAMDITNQYPSLKGDIAQENFLDIINYTNSLMEIPINKSDILVLAGGNYIMFYEELKYPLNKNYLYQNINQPYVIEKENMDEYDLKYFYETSLNKVKENNPETREWWDGTRGMRACVTAISNNLNSKYIIPTKISMVYGIASEIKRKLE